MMHVIQPHALSEGSRTADAAAARHGALARQGVQLWRSHAPQDVRDANRAAKEAAYAKWQQLVGLAGGSA